MRDPELQGPKNVLFHMTKIWQLMTFNKVAYVVAI